MRFAYRRYHVAVNDSGRAGVLYRPMIPIRVIGGRREVEISALVDTGADMTLLPRSIAEIIGADLDVSNTATGVGVGGNRISIAPGTVTLEVQQGRETYKWQANVGFATLDDPQSETAILGHSAFLERFVATFNGGRHELELTLAKSPGGST